MGETRPKESSGVVFAGSAYVIWGIMPLYWRLLDGVPSFALTMQRVAWTALFVGLVTVARGRLGHIAGIFAQRRLFGTLAMSGALIVANWVTFLYAVATNQLVETSLGYYLLPLLSIALGVSLFGERLSRIRVAAVGLAAAAVTVQIIELGRMPWIAFALALTFGFYGYFRKKAPVDPLDGLLIETGTVAPIALALAIFLAHRRSGGFPAANLVTDGLLVASGPLTAIPLALFAAGARRMRLSTLGFLQYVSPTITLAIAVLDLHERFAGVEAASFACIWAALLLVAVEHRVRRPATAPAGG